MLLSANQIIIIILGEILYEYIIMSFTATNGSKISATYFDSLHKQGWHLCWIRQIIPGIEHTIVVLLYSIYAENMNSFNEPQQFKTSMRLWNKIQVAVPWWFVLLGLINFRYFQEKTTPQTH